MRIITAEKESLEKIITALKTGQVLILPTDTVYGLICDASNKKAVEKIFKIKKRPKSKPLAVFVKDIKAAKKLAHVNKIQEKILKEKWPGKFTFILKLKRTPENGSQLSPSGSKLLFGKGATIGLRIPRCRLLNLILEKFKKPLAQTSANISGKPATTKIKEVLEQFSQQTMRPGLVVDAGNLPASKPSKVVVLTGKKSKTVRY